MGSKPLVRKQHTVKQHERGKSKNSRQMDLLDPNRDPRVDYTVARYDEAGRAHSPLPPSAYERWMFCPPSMAYVEALIKEKIIKARKSGDAAQRGHRIHSWGEQFIKWMLIGKKTTSVKGDEDELNEAREYAEFCVDLLRKAQLYDRMPEHGVEDTGVLDPKFCWGSRDFWIYAGGCLTIVDLKSGHEPVDVATTMQLPIYAVDLVERLEPEEVEMIVFQPNSDAGGPPAKRHTYTRDEFHTVVGRITTAVDRAKSYFGKPYKAMEDQLRYDEVKCGYCDALGVCPAARKHNMAVSKGNFSKPKEKDDAESRCI